jgi:hypothetical protein
MFYGHQHCPAPFATYSKPLSQAQNDEQYGCPDADLIVSWEQPYQRSRYAHDEQSEYEHRLAAYAVAVVAAHYASDGTGGEAYGVSAKGGERARQRVVVRKEEATEDERACSPVEKEVIPLDGSADKTGNGYFSN